VILARRTGDEQRGAHQLPWAARATVLGGRVDELRGLLERIGAGEDGAPSFPFRAWAEWRQATRSMR
jgi:hypothetical protein